MENCPSNETKSGNPCFELNNEKYNSMAYSYTAKIKGSPFFSVKQAEYVNHGRKCKKGWQCCLASTSSFPYSLQHQGNLPTTMLQWTDLSENYELDEIQAKNIIKFVKQFQIDEEIHPLSLINIMFQQSLIFNLCPFKIFCAIHCFFNLVSKTF